MAELLEIIWLSGLECNVHNTVKLFYLTGTNGGHIRNIFGVSDPFKSDLLARN